MLPLIAAFFVFWILELALGRSSLRGRGPVVLFHFVLMMLAFAVSAAVVRLLHLPPPHPKGEPGPLFHLFQLPTLPQLIAGVLLYDLVAYVQHRLQHEVPVLWRLHRLHHTDQEVDASTRFRFHPLDLVVRSVMLVGMAWMVNVPPLAAMIVSVISLPLGYLQHTQLNVLPGWLDRALRPVLVTGVLHRVHHSTEMRQTNSNYGFVFSFWDRLFRTYDANDGKPPTRYGLDEFTAPEWGTLRGMLMNPFVKVLAAPEPRTGVSGASGT